MASSDDVSDSPCASDERKDDVSDLPCASDERKVNACSSVASIWSSGSDRDKRNSSCSGSSGRTRSSSLSSSISPLNFSGTYDDDAYYAKSQRTLLVDTTQMA